MTTKRLHAHHWTWADYLALPDDGTRCEIIEGERLMTPSPFPPHQRVSERLGLLLDLFVARGGLGEVLRAPSDVALADDTIVQPDLFFFAQTRAFLIQDRGIYGAPDLVIEILSESHPERDTLRKRRVYAHHGVREYWIVDPASEGIDVFVLEEAKLVLKATHSDGEARSLAVLPGFAAPLAAVFER